MFLIGRGWQFIIGDMPLRVFFWNQGLLQPFIESVFGVPWFEYVTSQTLDSTINLITILSGMFFLLMGGLSFKIDLAKKFKAGYLACFGVLFIVFFLQFMGRFFYIGNFMEHTIQLITPLVFYWQLSIRGIDSKRWRMIKVAVASTFVGHGLFAVGIYPVPGHFVDMIINVFSVSQIVAQDLLTVVGSIDIACGIGLFVPLYRKYALGFMIFWGSSTAVARVLAHIEWEQFLYTASQWFAETLYRVPHGALPFAILVYTLSFQYSQETQTISE